METTAKLKFGPLEVEIRAQNDDDYRSEILELIQFIEENRDSFEDIGSGISPPEIPSSGAESLSLEEVGEEEVMDEEKRDDETSGPLGAISSRLRVSESELENFIYVDPDGDNFPILYIDEVGDIGNRKTDRQRVASLILLYVWHECYGESRIKSSSLKDALELSNVSSSGMGNMYQGDGDRYFDRRGRGPSATVSLTPPGKRQARKMLKILLQDGPDLD